MILCVYGYLVILIHFTHSVRKGLAVVVKAGLFYMPLDSEMFLISKILRGAYANYLSCYFEYVSTQVGKAHYELVDNLEADRVFSLARQIAPYSLEGMDIYSTVLYVS